MTAPSLFGDSEPAAGLPATVPDAGPEGAEADAAPAGAEGAGAGFAGEGAEAERNTSAALPSVGFFLVTSLADLTAASNAAAFDAGGAETELYALASGNALPSGGAALSSPDIALATLPCNPAILDALCGAVVAGADGIAGAL